MNEQNNPTQLEQIRMLANNVSITILRHVQKTVEQESAYEKSGYSGLDGITDEPLSIPTAYGVISCMMSIVAMAQEVECVTSANYKYVPTVKDFDHNWKYGAESNDEHSNAWIDVEK